MLYHRVPRLIEALAIVCGDGHHSRGMKALARVELPVLDDWSLSVLTHPHCRVIWQHDLDLSGHAADRPRQR